MEALLYVMDAFFLSVLVVRFCCSVKAFCRKKLKSHSRGGE